MLPAVFLLLVMQTTATPDFSFLAPTPIRITGARTVAEVAVLGRPIDGVVGPDGRFCVADASNGQITCLRHSGQVLWRTGREGEGPGEYRALSRITSMDDNGILAFDRGLNRLTRLDSAGRVIGTLRLPTAFRQVISLLAHGDNVLISGTHGMTVATHGVHWYRFADESLVYVRSFGPIPPASHPRLIEQWGTGTLAAGPTGGFLYSRRLPYEIIRYDREGRETGVIRPTVQLPYTVDDILLIRDQPNGTSYHILDVRIPVPSLLHVLSPPLLLSNRLVTRTNEVYWDFIAVPGGQTVSVSVPAESGVGVVFGVDRVRRLLWAFGQDPDGVPLVWRLEYAMR